MNIIKIIIIYHLSIENRIRAFEQIQSDENKVNPFIRSEFELHENKK